MTTEQIVIRKTLDRAQRKQFHPFLLSLLEEALREDLAIEALRDALKDLKRHTKEILMDLNVLLVHARRDSRISSENDPSA